MKFTAATIAAVLATGVFAKPSFTNTEINPQEGKPFTLTFNGCDEGCTIILQTGPNSQSLSDIRTLTSDAKGGSFDVTLSDLGSGSYNFKISNNSDGSEANYSTTFAYTGTGPTSFGSSSSASATTSGSSSASTESSSTGSTTPSDSSSTSSATSSSDSSSSTDSSSTDSSSTDSTSSTRSTGSSSTTSSKPTGTAPPSSGAVSNLSPLGFIGAAAAALLL